MTDDNSTNLVDMENLENFEKAFYGKQEEVKEISDENEDDSLDTDEDVLPSDDVEDEDEEDLDEDVDEDEEDAEPEEEAPKGKKPRKSFQTRIDELTAERYERDRQIEMLRRELDQLKVKSEEVKEEKPVTARDQLPSDAPNPDAVDDKGEPLYPLGEFDPAYIRALTKFTIEEEKKAMKAELAREQQEQLIAAEQQEVINAYTERFAEVEQEHPDLREKVQGLQTAFQNLDPAYGEFLATTIMSLEQGPQIMYYLSQNIGEAQKIVASGPAAAILSLGRLDARLAPVVKEEKRNKAVSKAPAPPEERARGRHGRFTVAPDTDDLAAFERVFFEKK